MSQIRYPHVLAWCLGILGLMAGPATASAAELFNGKDLDGWRYYLLDHAVGMEDVWSVQDGLLVCKGEPMGYLYTKAAFKNFRLQVEWRWAPGKKPGNSGVLMRITGKPMFLPRCIEAQLQSSSAGDLYGFSGMKISGDKARFRTISHKELGNFVGVSKISGNEKDPGEWNVYDIVVEGSAVKVSVNGKLVNEAVECDIAAGAIGLQSEGGEIHFRKVTITPLAD